MEEIIICHHCKGREGFKVNVMDGMHNEDPIYEFQACKVCNGTGKLMKSTKIEYKSFEREKL